MHHIQTFTITLIPQEDGAVRAVCLGLPNCQAVGGDRRQALERIEDVIRARIAAAVLEHRPIPRDRTSTKFLWLNVEEFLV